MARTIGIDLGTTNSVMATIEGGEPTVIPNAEGERLTPSVVAVTPSGERLVGRFARRQAVTNPENTIFSIKRFMGRKFDDPAVQRDKGLVPYQIRGRQERRHRGQDGRPLVQPAGDLSDDPAEAEDRRRGLPRGEGRPGGSNGTRLLRQRSARRHKGRRAHRRPGRAAHHQRADRLRAGLRSRQQGRRENLGLRPRRRHLRHLDPRICREGVFQVLATNGDTHLGGDDFDQAIIDYLADEFKKQEGIDLRRDRMALQRLKEAAEKAKIELSSVEQTDVNLPFITADASGPKHLNMTLTRAKLEQLTQPLVERTVPPMDAALKDAGQSKGDIDEVILVGGQTRMPAVQRKVQSFFGKEPHKGINPDEVVALGAAIQGGVLGGEVKDILLLDVTPLTLSIETLGGVATPLIERNTTIPTQEEPDLHHGFRQPAAGGDQRPARRAADGDRQQEPRQVHPGRLPPAPRGTPKIDVTFDIDANGILNVTAKDQATGKEQKITITGSSGLSEAEVQRMVQEAEANAEVDRQRREAISLRNDAEAMVLQAENTLREYGDRIPSELKMTLDTKVQAVKEILENDPQNADRLRPAYEDMVQSLTQVGTSMYEQAGAAGADMSDNGASPDGAAGAEDEETVDAEFREVGGE